MKTDPADRVVDALQNAARRLTAAGVDHPRLTADILLSELVGCPRLELPLHYAQVLDADVADRFRIGVDRLVAGEPLQYVQGFADFMGRRFKVDRRCLIPRPETEELVEVALALRGPWERERPVFVDVGTGSGCIAISLALARRRARGVAIDASPAALELARDNARCLGVAGELEFQSGDLTLGLPPACADLVVANLPYVPSGDVRRLPRHIREHEPASALDGGLDGLELIRRLVADAPRVLRGGGVVLLEIGDGQGEAVCACCRSHGLRAPACKRDVAGHERIVQASRQE